MTDDAPLILTAELVQWDVSLTNEVTLRLFAHGYSIEGDTHVFTALMEGQPCYEIEIARIPSEIIVRVRGGRGATISRKTHLLALP